MNRFLKIYFLPVIISLLFPNCFNLDLGLGREPFFHLYAPGYEPGPFMAVPGYKFQVIADSQYIEKVSWASSDNTVVSINQDGVAFCHKPGVATIQGKTVQSKNTDSLIVHVLDLETQYSTDPGPDLTWFTPDDVIEKYTGVIKNAAGNVTARISYNVNYLELLFYTYKYDGAGNILYTGSGKPSNARGKDMRMFTSDDEPYKVTGKTYHADGSVARETSCFSNIPDCEVAKATNITYTTYDKIVNADGSWLYREVEYSGRGSDNILFTSDDQAVRYTESTYNSANQKLTWRLNVVPGNDGVLFTVDDRPSNDFYYKWEYLVSGELFRTIQYTSGPDGLWFTLDDTPLFYYEYTYDVNANLIRGIYVQGEGADGIWFTADDVLTSNRAYTLDAAGLKTREALYLPGQDGIMGTADDEISYYNDYGYDASGRNNLTQQFTSPGPDGIWFSTDDVPMMIDNIIFDAQGRWLRYTRIQGGLDGICGTADDEHYSVGYTYDAAGNMANRIYYNGSGIDLVWGTADDDILDYNEKIYDISGNLLIERYRRAGNDGIWFTADDSISFSYEYAYDASGNKTRIISRGKSGPDGVWYTNDDILTYKDYSYDAGGNRILEIYYTGSGADGVWFSADDSISYYDTGVK